MENSANISLTTFAEALWACAERSRVQKVLDRARLNIPVEEDSLILLCLHLGPRYVISKILETEDQRKDLCYLLDIEIQNDDTEEDLIDHVLSSLSSQVISCHGVRTILKFSKLNLSDDLIENQALSCFRIIEGFIKDMYLLFIADMLYKHLSYDDQRSVKNFLERGRNANFRNFVEQINKYDSQIKKGDFPGFQEELEQLNGTTSILGNVKDSNIPLTLADIRNKYLAHANDSPKKVLVQKSKEVLKLVGEYFGALVDMFPSTITPVQFGVNEWGYRYIAYIDDGDVDIDGMLPKDSDLLARGRIDPDKCKRFYLLNDIGNFQPYQRAYCFHPNHSPLMYDPSLYYASYLRSIGDRLT